MALPFSRICSIKKIEMENELKKDVSDHLQNFLHTMGFLFAPLGVRVLILFVLASQGWPGMTSLEATLSGVIPILFGVVFWFYRYPQPGWRRLWVIPYAVVYWLALPMLSIFAAIILVSTPNVVHHRGNSIRHSKIEVPCVASTSFSEARFGPVFLESPCRIKMSPVTYWNASSSDASFPRVDLYRDFITAIEHSVTTK